MTIAHQYRQLIPTEYPGLEVEVIYNCESEITFDKNGYEIVNRLIKISATAQCIPLSLPKFPMESDGREASRFLGILREAVRQTQEYKQAEADAQPVKEYRHTMAETFPKFRPVLPGEDGYYE